MGALKLTACMKVVSKMGEMDQESLLDRLDRYTADGVPKDRAQVMAASDTLAELIDERREFMAMLREQHPDLFRVTNAIPEDQDVDPDAPDIKPSTKRQIERAHREVKSLASMAQGPYKIFFGGLVDDVVKDVAERPLSKGASSAELAKALSTLEPVAEHYAMHGGGQRVMRSFDEAIEGVSASDIKRSAGRSEEEIAVARADGWTIADNDLPSREAAERIVKLRTKGNSVVKPMAAWRDAEVRVVESDNPGLWSIEVRNPSIKRSPARDITNTPEFKRWFGDSKVVDESGAPLEVYHATGAKFNAFDPGKTGSNYPSYAKRGFFFYRSQQSATERAYEFGSNARLKRVYLSLQNPLVVTARSKGSAEEWFDRNNQTLYSRAEKAGSDGIIVKVNPDSNDYAAQEIFIAFEPTQIKSSRGNNGQFDSSNADITRSPARQTETPEFKEWFGDSVMTEDGRPGGEPMTLYHGGFNFADAPTGKAVPKTGNRGSLGVGFYMTPDQSRAQEYADENDGVVTQVYVRMNRPLEIRIGRGQDPMIEALVELGMPRGKAETKVESAYEKYGYIGSEVKKLALDAGYDGLIEYIDGRMSEVVAWTPTQVKSATDNDGQFSWNPDIRRSSARSPSAIFGRDIAPVAIKAYKSLSPRAKGIIDGWNVNWSMGQGKLRDSDAFAEVMAAYEPVREKLRQVYGDTIPAYRGEQRDGNESEGGRFLFSWTPMREIATSFAVNRRGGMPPEIPQSKVDEQIEAYRKTGIARLNGYKFVRQDPKDWEPDGPDYYHIYWRGEMQTDGDDIAQALQSEKAERDEYIATLREKGKLYTANIPVDSVAFIPVGVNLTEPEFVAEYNPRKDEAQEVKFSPARNAMGFYSALAKGVEDMQTKQAPAGAWKTQIKGLVNKGQVKQDEIEWSSIEDFLDLQQGKVTKDQILEYLRGNGVQVEEVTLGATGLDGVGEMYVDEANDYGDEWAVFTEEGGIIGGTYSTREEAEDAMASMSQDLPSKYSKYTLPGGENYREVLLTLPEKSDREMVYQVLGAYSADGFKSREEAQAYINDMSKKVADALEDPKLKEVGKVMQEQIDKYPFRINEYESKESRSKAYHSSHWDQRNVLAHIRVNDRTDADGKRVLFVEEIQSDWGQEGKKKGVVKSYKPDEVQPISAVEAGKMTVADEELFWHFKTPDNVFSIPKSKHADREAARDYIIREKKINSGGVPDAPFIGKTDGWLNLALKRVIAMAVDGGYDAVAFVNGDQSADRYDLSKQVDSITYEPTAKGYNINVLAGGSNIKQGNYTVSELEDIVGKEIVQKMEAREGRQEFDPAVEPDLADTRVLEGVDLKVGGEGMKAFYDKIVPNAVKALLKKTGGGQLEMVSIRTKDEGPVIQVDEDAWMPRESNASVSYRTKEEAEAAAIQRTKQPGFTITDAMREKVSTEGLPLFSRKRNPQEDTPEFKAWSGGAPVVHLGEKHEFRSGQPVVAEALHGTTNTDLAEFKRERANIESDWGAGFYASNTPDDVATNYASNDGADLTNRIEMMAERLASNEFDDDMEAARDEAKKRLTQESPNTLKLYVRMSNPAVQGGKGETFFDYTEDYDEETDSYDEPTGMLVDFVESLRNVVDDFDDVDVDGAMTKVWERATGDGIGLTDLVSILKSTDSMAYASDRNGDNATNEVIRRALEVMGFDGVIDTTVSTKFKSMKGMNKDTVHFIAFKPTQLKSATGNRGTFDPNDADITRSPGRTATGAAWDSPSAEKFDDLVYKLQDKLVDTKRVVEAIKTASGSIADDLNVYLQEELYHGRAAKRTEDFVNMELNPLIEQMARDGLKLEDVEEFMHARHAPEANAVIAQRNPGVAELQDGGSGMKTADALQYMATLPADLKQKLEAATIKVDAIIAKTRELYVDYELESRDTVDAWGRVFQHYIPLMREDKDGNGSPGLGQGFSVKGKETKGRTGSTRKVVDIMANIAMQRERAIVRGEKNRVSQALVGLATANPNEGFWQVDEVPTERVFNEKTGLVEDRVDPLYKSRENAVIAKIKGADGKVKEHAVLFNEEDPRALRMAQALKNLDANQIEGLLGVSAKITRYFAAINTQYNPVFGAVNLVRDVQGALLNLSSTPLAGDQAKIGRYTMSALRGIYADARAARKGNNPTSQWAALWDEFQEAGGQTGYRDLFATSADRAEAIKSTLNPDAWADSRLGKIFTANGALKVPMAQAKRGAGWIFQWLSDYNLAMENGVRLAAYKAGLEKGLSKEQAASAAKNITVNFNRKGQVSQQAGAMYAFFNASLQGTARLGQTLFDMEPGKPKTIRLSSTGKKIVYGGIMLGSIQALALAAAGFNDDDPPEFARERGLIIPIGGKKYLTIPMPLGFHVIPNIGRIATEFALSGFKDPHERALSLASLFADTFNPIGNSGLSMQTLAPTALDPLVALTENRDWTGKPIARESRNPAIPGHALGRDTASSIAKLLSEGINTLSGGNKYVAGVFSPTPDQIDYLLGQVTGGVGRELSKVEQTVLATARGEDLPTYKVPLVGRFVGDAKSQASEGAAFYANTERLNKLETEIKGLEKDGKRAEAAELRRNSSEAYLITVANQAERQIQRLRSEKRELVKAGAPREQVKAVEERITAVMARLNRAAEALREKQEG